MTTFAGRLRVGGAAVVVLLGLLTPIAGQQALPPPRDVGPITGPATGIIRGIVTAADTGQPIRSAEVQVRGSGAPAFIPLGAMTDADGRYEITGLPPGSYTLTATKTGFVTLAYGQTRVTDAGRQVDVASGTAVERIDLALPQDAVIVVQLADEFGDPLPAYRVTVFQPRFTDGRRTMTPVLRNADQVTDDRGEVRLSGLAPGEYYVAATPGTSSIAVSARAKQPQTFYPGTASETDALPVTVGLGDEIAISFPLADVRAARASGVIDGIVGRPPTLRLERRSLDGITMVGVTLTPDGGFIASNLVPADYVLTATGEKATGLLRFRVAGEDLNGLVLTMRPQAPLRGRFTFEPQLRGLVPANFILRLMITDGGQLLLPVAQVKSDWTFELPSAMGTGVLRFAQLPRGWHLRAILIGGVDMTDTPVDFTSIGDKPIEVRVTQRATRISGQAADASRRPVSNYVAVVFPDDRTQWTPHSRGIAAMRSDQQGRFTVEGLPAGKYLIAAVERLETGEERYAGTLERLRQTATPLTLQDAESATVDLTLSR